MKKLCILLTALALISCEAWAQQPRQRFSPEEFRARQERHIAAEAKLTKAEADKFFPVYREMKAKQRQSAMKAQALKRNHPAPNAAEKDYASVINQIAALDAEVAKIEADYYKRLCKVVSPKKVYAALLADDDFNRRMVQQAAGGTQGQQHHAAPHH
ncbi:MAG: hypothetical protein LUC44_01550 [Prevotellaceae bacterium]|nr:hypothetical protein [Prevotellaceae bacterium]